MIFFQRVILKKKHLSMSKSKQEGMKVDLREEKVIFSEFFSVKRAFLRHERFDGEMSPELRRYSFEKNNAVAALVYHVEKNAVLLVNQHRYPPMHHGVGWVTEVVAGGIDENEDPGSAIVREIEEEAGYRVKSYELMHDMYVSPGVFSERVKLYYTEVKEEDRVSAGGGVDAENEDIQLLWIPAGEIENWLATGKIIDAKTIVALYYFIQKKLNKKA